MARADSIAGQERRSLLLEQPSLGVRLLRIVVLALLSTLLFTIGLSIAVLTTR